MKRMIFAAALLMGSSATVMAQETGSSIPELAGRDSLYYGDEDMVSQQSQSSYQAYGTLNVPLTVQYNFSTANPEATNATWTRNGEFYGVRYLSNGRLVNTYYNEAGQSFVVALPVMSTDIPESVINRVAADYTGNIYDVTRIRDWNDRFVYQVRLIENGQVRTERISEDGTLITDGYVQNDAHASSEMNSGSGSAANSKKEY
jgi:hypothetical protein